MGALAALYPHMVPLGREGGTRQRGRGSNLVLPGFSHWIATGHSGGGAGRARHPHSPSGAPAPGMMSGGHPGASAGHRAWLPHLPGTGAGTPAVCPQTRAGGAGVLWGGVIAGGRWQIGMFSGQRGPSGAPSVTDTREGELGCISAWDGRTTPSHSQGAQDAPSKAWASQPRGFRASGPALEWACPLGVGLGRPPTGSVVSL